MGQTNGGGSNWLFHSCPKMGGTLEKISRLRGKDKKGDCCFLEECEQLRQNFGS